MRIQYFRYLFKNKFDVFYINEHIALYKKPYNITDDRTGASADFKSVDEMLKYKIDGLTIKDMILQLEHPYIPPLEGGRGAGGGDKTQSWGSAGNETGGDGSPYIPPAVANTKIKSKSLEGAQSLNAIIYCLTASMHILLMRTAMSQAIISAVSIAFIRPLTASRQKDART